MAGLLVVAVIPLVVVYVVWARRDMRFSMLMSWLASATRRGYPLADAVMCYAHSVSGKYRQALLDVAYYLRQGMPFTVALLQGPRVIPDDALGLIQSGEASGKLDKVFAVLAARGGRSHSRRMKILGLALYPLVLLVAAALPGLVLVMLVEPKMQALFNDWGAPMPDAWWAWPVYWRIGIYTGLVLFAYLLLAGFPSPGLSRRTRVWGIFDAIKWRLPGARQFERYEGIRLFAQSLAIELSGGVPMRDALRRAAEVRAIRGVGLRLDRLCALVESGRPLSEAAAGCGLFPHRFVRLIAAGEQTGDLLPALDEIVVQCDDSCESIADVTSAIVVPCIVFAMGFAVMSLGAGLFSCLAKLLVNLLW